MLRRLNSGLRGMALAVCLAVVVPGGAAGLPDRADTRPFIFDGARGDDRKLDPGSGTANVWLRGAADAARRAAAGHPLAGAVSLGEASVDALFPSVVGDDVPDWLRRVEIEGGINEDGDGEFAVLGVIPLFETEDLKNTVFTQISQRRYRYLDIDRDVTNVGLGYRHLWFDNTVLTGVNAFFDYGWEYGNQRASVGLEAKWAGLDFTTNHYFRASTAQSAGADGTTEDVLDGRDVRLAVQVPYLPWARVHGRGYWWDTNVNDDNVEGWETGIELDLHQNLQVEAGVSSDNFMADDDEHQGYVLFRWHFDLNRPVALSRTWVADKPWALRDMREHRLDKVRRENKIITERVSSGVVITRGT